MAQHTRHQGLRVDVPTLEPDDVLLDRLAATSAASIPTRGSARSRGRSWSVGVRMSFVATVVASLGATTWAAGALAGVDVPFRHQQIERAPMVPMPPTGSAGTPHSDASPSGSPEAGLPDAFLRGAATALRRWDHVSDAGLSVADALKELRGGTEKSA